MEKLNDPLPPQPDFGPGRQGERIHDAINYAPRPAAPAAPPPAGGAIRPSGTPPPRKPFQPPSRKSDEIDFLKYAGILFRRKRLIIFAIFVALLLAFIKNLGEVDLYQAETKLLVQLRQQNPVGQFDPGYFWDRQTKINTMLNTIRSREVLRRVADQLGSRFTPASVGSMITAQRIQETNIIRLTAVSEVPEEAAGVANTLANVFIEFNNEINRKDIADGLSYIERQIYKTEKELKEKEETLKTFQETHRIVVNNEESNPEYDKLNIHEAALQSTKIQIAEIEEKIHRTLQQLNKQETYVEESAVLDNSIEAELVQLNVELANTLAEYGEKHFRVATIREKIRKQMELAKKTREGNFRITSKKSLNQNRVALQQDYNNLIVERFALIAKQAAYEQVLQQTNSNVLRIPEIQLQYRRLVRDKSNIEAVYQLLQTKYQEQRIRFEMQTADVVQWEAAVVPRGPIQSGSRFDLLIVLLIGFIAGTTLAFIIEYFDQTVKSPQAIEEELGLPILGIIPLMDGDNKVIDLESKSSILEPYRSLRTNIRYTNIGAGKRSLLITSAIQGDGKTTKVCNLAFSFAMDGKTVMVVDADLRRAAIHKILGIEKERGLSDYLTGQLSFPEIEKKVFNGMITAVTAGSRPPNPAELLGSPRFKTLVEEGLARYDIVLIDSPAIVPVSDALLLAPYADSTIIIGRALKTPLKAMTFTKDSLVRSGANLIGLVFNGVEQRKGYYPYYYSYYSYYSYYKSRYYYYEDDEEIEKLPKNFKEFILFSLRQAARELLSNTRHAARWVFQVFRGGSLFRKSLLVLAVGVLSGALLFTAARRAGFFGGSDSALPAGFKYVPYLQKAAAPPPAAIAVFPDTIGLRYEINRTLDNWRRARESNNIYAYRNFYSMGHFRFKYGGYTEWVAMKDSLFKLGPIPRIRLDSLLFQSFSDSESTVLVRQLFQADTASPADTLWKEIRFRREIGNWKITREEKME